MPEGREAEREYPVQPVAVRDYKIEIAARRFDQLVVTRRESFVEQRFGVVDYSVGFREYPKKCFVRKHSGTFLPKI